MPDILISPDCLVSVSAQILGYVMWDILHLRVKSEILIVNCSLWKKLELTTLDCCILTSFWFSLVKKHHRQVWLENISVLLCCECKPSSWALTFKTQWYHFPVADVDKYILKTSCLHKISITEPCIDGLYSCDYVLWFYRIIKMKSRQKKNTHTHTQQHRRPINPRVILAFQNENQCNELTARLVTRRA